MLFHGTEREREEMQKSGEIEKEGGSRAISRVVRLLLCSWVEFECVWCVEGEQGGRLRFSPSSFISFSLSKTL